MSTVYGSARAHFGDDDADTTDDDEADAGRCCGRRQPKRAERPARSSFTPPMIPTSTASCSRPSPRKPASRSSRSRPDPASFSAVSSPSSERPLGDIVWGVSRTLLRANKALLAPYASKNKDAVPADFRDADDLLARHQRASAGDPAEHQAHSGRRRARRAGTICWTRNGRARSPSPIRPIPARPIPISPCWRSSGATTTRRGTRSGSCSANTKVLNRSSLVFQGVGSGEFALGMSLEYAGYQWSSNGAPVKVIYPPDGTIAQMEGVAIIKGGPNTENAQAFCDYVSRKDVREKILGFAFRRAARRISTSRSCRARCRSSPTSSSSTMTRTPGWISAPKPRRRSRISSGVRADEHDPESGHRFSSRQTRSVCGRHV